MKSKLILFIFMFSIWCLINILTMVLLRVKHYGSYFAYDHSINFIVAFILSVIAAIQVRYFYIVIIIIASVTLCFFIPGLIQGSLIGDNGFVPVALINNGLFVHNEFILGKAMNFLIDRMSANQAIFWSAVFIILLSAYIMVFIRELAFELRRMLLDKREHRIVVKSHTIEL